MSTGNRSRASYGQDEPDEWLVDAARRAGHALPAGERPSGTSAWRVLLNAGVPDDEVLRLACAGSGADPADFSQLNPSLADVLPHGVALKHRVAPLAVHRGTLAVATSNPRNAELERDLAFAARQRVRLYAASPTDVIRAQGAVYGSVYGSRSGMDASLPLNAPPAAAPAPTPPPPPAPPAPEPRRAPPPRRSLPMTMPVDVEGEEAMPSFAIEPDSGMSLVERTEPALELTPAQVDDPEPALSAMAEPEFEVPLVARAEVEPEPALVAAEPAEPEEPLVAAAAEPPPEPAPAPPPAATPDVSVRLLATAIAEHATEVILEPTPDGGLLVRLGVDGTLYDRFRIPEAQAPRLIQLLKQRAKLDPALPDARVGRISMESKRGPVIARLVTEPAGGARERVSLRVRTPRDLVGTDDLGLAPAELQRVRTLVEATSGLLAVAGPAGAGRTTTLYALAATLAESNRRVATVEAVVEYPIPGVTQHAVSDAPDGTTASVVRTALEAEGDVLVIDAPLDRATLQQDKAAATRSRLVVAALGTPDLPATLTALQALHADRARFAATLGGVIVQRLLRRLCPACAAPQSLQELPEQQQRLLAGLPMTHVRRAVGCTECHGSGYKGRVAIAQVVLMTPGFRVALRRGAAADELARLALDSGAPSLWTSGLERVLRGVTSLAELVDSVTPSDEAGTAPQEDIDALLSQLLGAPASVDAAPEPEPPAPEPSIISIDRVARTSGEMVAASFTLLPTDATTTSAPGPALVSATPPPAPAASAEPPCVLLVDDDPATRRALAQALSDEGFRVLQAADGTAALVFARRLRPDVILTEVALPGLDALGLLAALADEYSTVPVVVHTDQAEPSLHAWLVECGARGVLRRGIAAAELADRLRAVVTPA